MNHRIWLILFALVALPAQGILKFRQIAFTPIPYAQLGTPPDGAVSYCSDCTLTAPATAGGDGAFVRRENGLWNAAGALMGAPAVATYITQAPDALLSGEQALSLLATGILKSTAVTGVLSIATAGTDYAAASHTHAWRE